MTSPSFSRGLPWMREMDSPGKNLPIACRPSVTMTRGRSTSRCRRSQTSQAATSSGSGSRFSGGRCRTTFVMNTFRRSRPIPARSSSRNWPAAPTNGLPCTSSWYPGASPRKNRPDSPVPSPGTAWRALRWSGQARQARISAATALRSIGAASFTARDYGGRAAVLRWHFACCAHRDGVGRDQRTHARLQSRKRRQAWPADRPRSLSRAEARRRGPSDRRRQVELYRDGAVAQFHLVQHGVTGGPGDAFGLPRFEVQATDDRGTAYKERPYGGSGGGTDGGGVVWRMASAFAPAVPEGARELRLRVAEVVWSTLSGSEMVDSQRTAGLWEFRIRLVNP